MTQAGTHPAPPHHSPRACRRPGGPRRDSPIKRWGNMMCQGMSNPKLLWHKAPPRALITSQNVSFFLLLCTSSSLLLLSFPDSYLILLQFFLLPHITLSIYLFCHYLHVTVLYPWTMTSLRRYGEQNTIPKNRRRNLAKPKKQGVQGHHICQDRVTHLSCCLFKAPCSTNPLHYDWTGLLRQFKGWSYGQTLVLGAQT